MILHISTAKMRITNIIKHHYNRTSIVRSRIEKRVWRTIIFFFAAVYIGEMKAAIPQTLDQGCEFIIQLFIRLKCLDEISTCDRKYIYISNWSKYTANFIVAQITYARVTPGFVTFVRARACVCDRKWLDIITKPCLIYELARKEKPLFMFPFCWAIAKRNCFSHDVIARDSPEICT